MLINDHILPWKLLVLIRKWKMTKEENNGIETTDYGRDE